MGGESGREGANLTGLRGSRSPGLSQAALGGSAHSLGLRGAQGAGKGEGGSSSEDQGPAGSAAPLPRLAVPGSRYFPIYERCQALAFV